MNPMKISRLLFAIGTSVLFVAIGLHLIKKEDSVAQFFGYANIIFFGLILILAIVGLFKKTLLKKNSEK